MDKYFYHGAMSVSFAFSAITPTKTVTSELHNNAALWLSNKED